MDNNNLIEALNEPLLSMIETGLNAVDEKNEKIYKNTIKEYLVNIKNDLDNNAEELKEKLLNTKYEIKFAKGLVMISAIIGYVAKVSQLKVIEINSDIEDALNKKLEEFLDNSKDDDSFIFDMKMYHLKELNSENMYNLSGINESSFANEKDYKNYLLFIKKISKEYDDTMNLLMDRYLKTIS